MRTLQQGERTCEQSSISRRLVAETEEEEEKDQVEIQWRSTNAYTHKVPPPCLLASFLCGKPWDACDVCLGTCVYA